VGPNEAFCTGCGKPRLIIPGYTSIDERYPVVACGSVKRPGTMDAAEARAIIKARRARRKERKALLAATYGVSVETNMRPVR